MTRSTYQDNQLDKTLTTHERTNGKTLTPETLGQSGGKGTSNDLAKEGAGDNRNDISPGGTVIEQTKISVETR